MNKQIKIVLSPFNPPLEVVDKIVIKTHVPYSDRNVTIQVCPNIQEYTENADAEGISVRQVMLTTPIDQTTTVSLDLTENRKKTVIAEDTEYEIELLKIGAEDIQGQQFKTFEFNVSWG